MTALTLFNCDGGIKPKETNFRISGRLDNVEIYEIDSCEYIVVGHSQSQWGTHKGNCKFCKKRNEKQLPSQRDTLISRYTPFKN